MVLPFLEKMELKSRANLIQSIIVIIIRRAASIWASRTKLMETITRCLTPRQIYRLKAFQIWCSDGCMEFKFFCTFAFVELNPLSNYTVLLNIESTFQRCQMRSETSSNHPYKHGQKIRIVLNERKIRKILFSFQSHNTSKI